MSRPVCLECGTDFKAKENGIVVLTSTSQHKKLHLTLGDLYVCPVCDQSIAIVAPMPFVFAFEEERFKQVLDSYPAHKVFNKTED